MTSVLLTRCNGTRVRQRQQSRAALSAESLLCCASLLRALRVRCVCRTGAECKTAFNCRAYLNRCAEIAIQMQGLRCWHVACNTPPANSTAVYEVTSDCSLTDTGCSQLEETYMKHLSKIQRRLAASGLVASFALAIANPGIAVAADLQDPDVPYVKAPPSTPSSDIHGFFDMTFGNDYSTTRGLLVTNTGLAPQALAGLSFDLYKNANSMLNKVSVYGGISNEFWTEQHDPKVGSWNEFDWFVGTKVSFLRDWSASVEYDEFLSPPGGFLTERHLNVTVGYDDTSWGLPIAFKPYVRFWDELDGSPDVVTGVSGGSGDSYYFEFGMVPTLDLKKYGANVVLTAPTWVSVGPSSYWNRGITGCGLATTTCALSNLGVFSTGLTATAPLTFMPASYGKWYVKAGFQYYYLLNDSLRLAQTFTGTATSYADSHKDYALGFVGLGFTF